MNVNLFINFSNCIILIKDENGRFRTFSTLLLEGETSIRAVERIVYDEFKIHIDIEKTKLLSTKIFENNFFDYWKYTVESDELFEKILSQNENFVVTHIGDFHDRVEKNLLDTYVDINEIIDILGIVKKKSKTRPLVIKNNLY